MSLRTTFKLPREHGAWAIFYVPFVMGVMVAGKIDLAVISLIIAATAIFISRESLLIYWRARARGRVNDGAARSLHIYLAIAAVAGSPLIFIWRLIWLVPMGLAGIALLLINGQQGVRLEERSVGSEILAICGLTLTAPAGFYVARGAWEVTAFWLWLLSICYFTSSVFYIKLRIYGLNPRKHWEQLRVHRTCVYYHSFLLLALLVLLISGNLPLFAVIAFAPVLCRTFWRLAKPVKKVNLARAGLLEIGYSMIFLICMLMSFRLI